MQVFHFPWVAVDPDSRPRLLLADDHTEILRAFEWEEEDEYIGTGPDEPAERVKLVYDILKDDRELYSSNEEFPPA